MAETVLDKEPIVEKPEHRFTPARIGERWKDGVELAKKIRKTSAETAEELLEETKHQIKRHPAGTVLGALGVGIAIGAVIGLLVRKSRNS